MASMSGWAGVMSSQVAKPGEAGALLLHVVDRGRRHELGALRAEQVGVGDQEIFDAALSWRLPPDRWPCQLPVIW